MSKKMNGAQAFFKTLVDGGIDTVFGCPGTSEMQIIEELGHTDLHCVLGLQENIVTGMAKKGPHLIEAQIVSSAPATIKLIRDNLVL